MKFGHALAVCNLKVGRWRILTRVLTRDSSGQTHAEHSSMVVLEGSSLIFAWEWATYRLQRAYLLFLITCTPRAFPVLTRCCKQ